VARAATKTLLRLDRYAQIMGINPVHFAQAIAGEVFPIDSSCGEGTVWYQYAWQHMDYVGRDELARAIAEAEEDLARLVGYWPAPKWVEEEIRAYPRYYRRDLFRLGGTDVRGARVGVKTRWGKIIAPGQRATSEIGTATVTYTDEDGDGLYETATVSIATTVSDVKEIHVYYEGYGGRDEWEIRPTRTKTLSGGTFTATFWSWQLIDPDYWEAFPGSVSYIDIYGQPGVAHNYFVTSVDVYRVYNDTTQASARFYWEPLVTSSVVCRCGGSGCPSCQLTTQDGCLVVRDPMLGIVAPAPATYDEDEGEWSGDCFTLCRDPDYVKLWYYAGEISEDYLAGRTDDPLSDFWARNIAYLATARLEYPICGCGSAQTLSDRLRGDLAVTESKQGPRAVSLDVLDNPLGTLRGEVEVWRRIKHLVKDRVPEVAVV